MTFQHFVKDARSKLDCSQEEFGALVGYTQRSVGFWESGDRAPKVRMQEAIIAKIQKLLRRVKTH